MEEKPDRRDASRKVFLRPAYVKENCLFCVIFLEFFGILNFIHFDALLHLWVAICILGFISNCPWFVSKWHDHDHGFAHSGSASWLLSHLLQNTLTVPVPWPRTGLWNARNYRSELKTYLLSLHELGAWSNVSIKSDHNHQIIIGFWHGFWKHSG